MENKFFFFFFYYFSMVKFVFVRGRRNVGTRTQPPNSVPIKSALSWPSKKLF